jgi:hypothetical protein
VVYFYIKIRENPSGVDTKTYKEIRGGAPMITILTQGKRVLKERPDFEKIFR